MVAQAAGAVEICECPGDLASLKRRPGLLHWRVPDANFPGRWYDTWEDVVPARTAKAMEREGFSRRGLIRSMFCSSTPDGSLKEGSEGEAGKVHLSTRALGIDRCMRILPHDNDSGAFFVTLLCKKAPVTFAPPHGLEADLTTAAAPPAPAGGDAVEHAQTAELRSANSGAEGSTGDVEDKTDGAGSDLPKGFVDNCTRLTRMEARVQKVEPYVPLERLPDGRSTWESIAAFYGVSSEFPSHQLLAHSERVKTIHYVTAAARRALDAAQPGSLAGGNEYAAGDGTQRRAGNQDLLNVVVAGTRMFEKDHATDCPCLYRVCMDGVRFLMPYLSDKRRVLLGRALVEELLEKRLAAIADCPEHLQQMETGSLVGVCEVTGSPLVLWRGKTHVRSLNPQPLTLLVPMSLGAHAHAHNAQTRSTDFPARACTHARCVDECVLLASRSNCLWALMMLPASWPASARFNKFAASALPTWLIAAATRASPSSSASRPGTRAGFVAS